MPSYKIQVWYWRTHDMLISQESEVLTDKQKITCSSSLPLTVAQFSHSSGKLVVWEVHGTQKFCKLIKRKIHLDFLKTDGPFEDVYSIDGNIQIVNRNGDIYYVIPSSGSVNLIAKWNGAKGHHKTCISFIRNGILLSGPDGTLKYFKRQKYVWNEIFQTPTLNPFIALKGFHDNESVIGITVNGELHRIVLSDGDKVNIIGVKTYDTAYGYFALIQPLGDHLLVVDLSNEIRVKAVETGLKVATLTITDQTITRSNPRYPFIAIGNKSGDVTFVSLFDPANPKVLSEFLLSRRSIANLKFSDCGHFTVVIDKDFNFFIIRSVPGKKMTILHHFKEQIQIVDFFVIEHHTKLEIAFLCATADDSTSGDLLRNITIDLDDVENSETKERKLPANYMGIVSMPDSVDKFYAIRHGVRYIEVLKLEEDSVVLSGVIETPHQLRHLEANCDGQHLVSWSIDGTVAAYDICNNHELLVAFVANNRHNFGTKIAHCDARCELMVTLDQSGNLICSELNTTIPSKARESFEETIEKTNEKIARMFSLATSGGFPGLSMEHFGKKFTDLKSEQTYQMEARESEQTRKLLFAKLESLRSQVKFMLDENETHADDEKLEVQDFNLNLITTAQKELEARQDRNQEEKKMMDYIEAQTTMNNWIIEKCWNPMEVKGAKLRGMFINLFVDNFPLLPEVKDRQMQKIGLMRAIENSVARQDAFLPWRPISTL